MKADFLANLDALALKVTAEGVQEGKQYHERIDALKAATAYYVARTKGQKPDDSARKGGFARAVGFEEDANGSTRVRPHRGRRGQPPVPEEG